jgi:hypothetical protein
MRFLTCIFLGLSELAAAAAPGCQDVMFGVGFDPATKEKLIKTIYYIPTLKTNEEIESFMKNDSPDAKRVQELLQQTSSGEAIVVSSNLKGAMGTAYAIVGNGLKSGDRIYSMSALNKYKALSSPVGAMVKSDIKVTDEIVLKASTAEQLFDFKNVNSNNKVADRHETINRLQRFCKWLAHKSEKEVIVFGHRDWLSESEKSRFIRNLIPSGFGIMKFELTVDLASGCS